MNARRRGPYSRLGKRKKGKKEKKKGYLEVILGKRERGRGGESSLKRGTVGFRATGRNKKESFRPDEKFDSDRGGLFAIPIEFRDANQLKSRFNLPTARFFLLLEILI